MRAAAFSSGVSSGGSGGAQKLLGWFGGHGLDGTVGFFESLGFRPGRAFALAAGLAEVGGGLDAFLGLESLWTPSVAWTAIGLGILGGIANLFARRSPATV